MPNRFLALATALVGVSFGLGAIAAPAGGVSPAEAQKRLSDGNQRFAQGQSLHPNCDESRRRDTAAHGQHPIATILTCSDSRVAPERIFDLGVGDAFVIRVAGNVSDTDEIGSIEYGVEHLHTPLLVVMGHGSCGAVAAVAGGAELDGCLPQLVDNIVPAVRQTRRANPGLGSEALIAKAVEANVFQSIADLFMNSGDVRELVEKKELKVVGAVYDLGSGSVRWLGEHPEQSALARGGKPSGWQPRTIVLGATTEKSQAPGGGHAQATAGDPPTPPAAFQMLRDGNARFVAGTPGNPRSDRARLAATAKVQHPFATVMTCSDSRVPVERVFDQGIGDLFTIRVAGNVSDTDEIASIEYGVGHLDTPLLAVLGHSSCGAVSAVATSAEVRGSIAPLIANIRPAVKSVQTASPDVAGDQLIPAAVRANVRQSIADLLARSPIVRERAESGRLLIVGGVYDLAAGTIEWFSPTGEPWRDGAFSSASNSAVKSSPTDTGPPGKGNDTSADARNQHPPGQRPGSNTPGHESDGDKPMTPPATPPQQPGQGPPVDEPDSGKTEKPVEPTHDSPANTPPNEPTPAPKKDPGHGEPTSKPATDEPKAKPATEKPATDKPEHP